MTALVYGIYLVCSIGMTVWVVTTLSRNGQVFLVDAFDGNEELASAVNRMLGVGFYLVSLGYIALSLKVGDQVGSATEAIEVVSRKLGAVLLALGVVHLGNIWLANRLRHRPARPYRHFTR